MMDERDAELQQWKRIAAYMASCHAGTLESMPKSAPKSTRARMISICAKADSYLSRLDLPPNHFGQHDPVVLAADRCKRAAERYK